MRDARAGAARIADAIVGVGLDSAELGHPASEFAGACSSARATPGFHAVAHAGRRGSARLHPAGARPAARRAHRPRRALRWRIPARWSPGSRPTAIPLTVCPLSNVKLRVVDDLEHHPLSGCSTPACCATVNSDDPAYFGGYVARQLRRRRAGAGARVTRSSSSSRGTASRRRSWTMRNEPVCWRSWTGSSEWDVAGVYWVSQSVRGWYSPWSARRPPSGRPDSATQADASASRRPAARSTPATRTT